MRRAHSSFRFTMSLIGRAPRRRKSSVEEIPPRELSIDLVADERLGRVTAGPEPRDKGRFGD